jgi:putative redox protein
MVSVNWLGGLAFEADPPSGFKWILDAGEAPPKGPTPLESLLAAAASCSAVDVVLILQKKRQTIASYRVEIDGERSPEPDYPRPYREIRIRHILKGENLDPKAVARAVQLSDEKYCTVIATLRAAPHVTSEWSIED